MTTYQRNLLGKFFFELKKEGFASATRMVFAWFLIKIKNRVGLGDEILKRRSALSNQIDQLFDSTVRYGLFRGLKLPTNSWWGATDRAGMLLGLYEQEVLAALNNIPPTYKKTFIDLGAADGYYGIGVLVNNLFDRSYCFEINDKGRETLKNNAILNNVIDRVQVFGSAEKDFYSTLPDLALTNSTLMVDIEGAEFDILTAETFKRFSKSAIIIELHDHFFSDGHQKLERLIQSIGDSFEINELTTTNRDLSVFPELKKFSDTDRWLICSEGRKSLPHWYVLMPRLN